MFLTRSVKGTQSVQRQECYLNIDSKTDLLSALTSKKDAGVTSIVLTGKYDESVVRYVSSHGFDTIIEVDADNIDRELLEKYAEAGLSGIRLVIKNRERFETIEKDYNNIQNMLATLNFRTIPTISYDFVSDYKDLKTSILKTEEDISKVIAFFNEINKEREVIELVVDASTYLKYETNFNGLNDNVKVIMRVESNSEAKLNQEVVDLLKKLGVKVAICSKTVYRDNIFKSGFAYIARILGRDFDLSEILADSEGKAPEKLIASVKDLLEGGFIDEETFEKMFSQNAKDIIRKAMDKAGVQKEDKEKMEKELSKYAREFIIGSMIAKVERKFITSDVRPGEKNYRILVGAALLMMVDGMAMEDIKEQVEKVDIKGDGSISQLLNAEDSEYAKLAKKILSMWKSDDMKITMAEKADTIALAGIIKLILAIDTVLPESNTFSDALKVSLDGYKGMLAAA